jgi:hypothetical protein
VAASAPCRERCCGPGGPETFCLACPCTQPGCWPTHLPYWIRNDVQCPGAGDRDPPMCELHGFLKITQPGGQAWCYRIFAGISRTRAELPIDARIIEPGTGPAIECIGTIGELDPCFLAECLPDEGGECPCGCEGVCAELLSTPKSNGPCNGAFFCCGGQQLPNGDPTFDWNYTRTLRQSDEFLVMESASHCCGNNNSCGECYNGVVFQTVHTTGVEVSRSGCTVCKEINSVSTGMIAEFPGCQPQPFTIVHDPYIMCRRYAESFPYGDTLQEFEANPTGFGCPRDGFRIQETSQRSCTASRRYRLSEAWQVAGGQFNPFGCGCNIRDWNDDEEQVIYTPGPDPDGCCPGCQLQLCGGGVYTGGECEPLFDEPIEGPGVGGIAGFL